MVFPSAYSNQSKFKAVTIDVKASFILNFIQGCNEISNVHISCDWDMYTIVTCSKGADYGVAFKCTNQV